MKKFLKVSVSLILVIILFAMAMPIYALNEISVKEIEELREENVKHFDMGDGTYKLVVYNEPVHRKDAEGKWQDIDNTLEAEKENGNTSYKTADGRIKFSKNVKNANGKIFELSENGYKIAFSLIDNDVKSSSASIKNHKGKKTPTVFDGKEEQYAKLQSVDNLTKIKYNDIKEDIDIEYLIYSNNIKENIIVNSRQDSYVYSFELKLNKLTALLNSDGSISLNDEKTAEEKYTMPAPFMLDDNGELSENVHYTLTPSGKYKYVLTITADTEWINAKGREFPVTIDPTVEVTNSYDEAYISSTSPNSNYGSPSDGRLYISPTQRTFLKFQLPNIGSNVRITGAELIASYYFSQYGSATLGVYEVPYSWNKNTITWNNSVASHQVLENSTEPFTQEPLSGSSESYPYTVHFDITEAVSGWYAGRANNGIAIKCMSSSDSPMVICGYNYVDQNSYYDYDRVRFEITYQTVSTTYDGTYYFRHISVDTYMQLILRDTDNYDRARLHPFNGSTEQKWNVTYLHNGYYSITSALHGWALTANIGTDNEMKLTEYSGMPNQMWSITVDSNGIYKISPKNNSTSCLTSGAIINSSEPNERYLVLSQSSSTANGNEWIFYEVSTNWTANFELQEESNWCWVACAWNFSRCFVDALPSQENMAQYAIIQKNGNNFIQNGNYNKKGDNDYIQFALEFVFGTTNVKKGSGYLDEEPLIDLLDRDIPIIAAIFDGGHYVLIYNYRKEGQNTILYVFDPYDFENFQDEIPNDFDNGPYEEQNFYTISLGDFNTTWDGWVTTELDDVEYAFTPSS